MDGAPGPAGPTGATGPQGPAGTSVGLRGSFDFEEGSGTTSADASGSANTVTLNTSGVSWTTAGHTGNALNFDGASGFVEAQPASSLNLREEVSISAWVYQTGNATGANTVVAKEGEYVLQVNNGQVQMAVQTVHGPAMAFVGGGQVPLNTWVHVKGTYDGLAIRTFLNGEMVSYSAYPHGIIASGMASLRIGGRSAGSFFTGRIDEVRISAIATGETVNSPRSLLHIAGPGMSDWRNNAGTAAVGTWVNIPLRTLTFTKRFPTSALRITYQDTLGTNGPDYGGCHWRILVNGASVASFSDADMTSAYVWKMSNAAHQAWALNAPAGSTVVTVQNHRGSTTGECLMGWNTAGSFLSVEEIP